MNKKQVEITLSNIKRFYREWDYESFLKTLRSNKYLKETDFSSFDFESPNHFLLSLQDKYDEVINWNRFGLIDPAKTIAQKASQLYEIEGSKTFITNNHLMIEVENLCKKLPKLKGVVGIPRSGLLPASLVSNYLSIPLYSLTNDSIVKLYSQSDNGGGRMHNYVHDESLPLLVLDDTCFSGHEIRKVKSVLGENNILYASVFTTNPGKTNLDFYSKTLSYPHVLEWNLFDAEPLKNGVLDMDGVLCEEIPVEVGKTALYAGTDTKALYQILASGQYVASRVRTRQADTRIEEMTGTDHAYDVMMLGAKGLAFTALDLFTDSGLLKSVKEEHKERVQHQ